MWHTQGVGTETRADWGKWLARFGGLPVEVDLCEMRQSGGRSGAALPVYGEWAGVVALAVDAPVAERFRLKTELLTSDHTTSAVETPPRPDSGEHRGGVGSTRGQAEELGPLTPTRSAAVVDDADGNSSLASHSYPADRQATESAASKELRAELQRERELSLLRTQVRESLTAASPPMAVHRVRAAARHNGPDSVQSCVHRDALRCVCHELHLSEWWLSLLHAACRCRAAGAKAGAGVFPRAECGPGGGAS